MFVATSIWEWVKQTFACVTPFWEDFRNLLFYNRLSCKRFLGRNALSYYLLLCVYYNKSFIMRALTLKKSWKWMKKKFFWDKKLFNCRKRKRKWAACHLDFSHFEDSHFVCMSFCLHVILSDVILSVCHFVHWHFFYCHFDWCHFENSFLVYSSLVLQSFS